MRGPHRLSIFDSAGRSSSSPAAAHDGVAPLWLAASSLAMAAGVIVIPAPARAENAAVGLFHGAAPATGYFHQEGPRVVENGAYQLGVTFDLGSELLVARDPATGELVMDGELVGRRASLHLVARLGLWRNLEVGLAVSTALQSGDDSPFRAELRRAGLGDLRAVGKLGLWQRGRWRTAASLELALPTSSDRAYLGDETVAATGLMTVGVDGDGWCVSAQAGYRARGATRLGDLELDDEVIAGIAGRYPLLPGLLWAQAEAYGAAGVNGKGNELERPVEALAGVRVQLGAAWIVQAGLGTGLTQGYGTAELRGVISVGLIPTPPPSPQLARREWTPPEDDEPVDVAASPAAAAPELQVIGDRIVLPSSVLFDVGGDELHAEGRAVLQQILELWQRSPSWTAMSIEGHTDVRGSSSLNQALSERRASNVREALLSLGASAAAVTSVGFGETRPVSSGQSEADHARNRRVEFVITRRQVEVP
jgi:outer membrane protein OmpA-like peptidoglycan-associated protein